MSRDGYEGLHRVGILQYDTSVTRAVKVFLYHVRIEVCNRTVNMPKGGLEEASLLSRAPISPSSSALNTETRLARLRRSLKVTNPHFCPTCTERDACSLLLLCVRFLFYYNVFPPDVYPWVHCTISLHYPRPLAKLSIVLSGTHYSKRQYLHCPMAQICPGVPYEEVRRLHRSVCVAVSPSHSPAIPM